MQLGLNTDYGWLHCFATPLSCFVAFRCLLPEAEEYIAGVDLKSRKVVWDSDAQVLSTFVSREGFYKNIVDAIRVCLNTLPTDSPCSKNLPALLFCLMLRRDSAAYLQKLVVFLQRYVTLYSEENGLCIDLLFAVGENEYVPEGIRRDVLYFLEQREVDLRRIGRAWLSLAKAHVYSFWDEAHNYWKKSFVYAKVFSKEPLLRDVGLELLSEIVFFEAAPIEMSLEAAEVVHALNGHRTQAIKLWRHLSKKCIGSSNAFIKERCREAIYG